MGELRGKVVLVDFWTYSCVNCVRTIPHLRSWYDTYRDHGFVIIGVHTPEFTFERDRENVQEAMQELGVNWPVVLDNEYEQWRAYNNRYWPAHYFIDAAGRVRYFHFGEGKYDTSEDVIRALLEEAGSLPTARAAARRETELESKTAETYLGYGRARGFSSEVTPVPNKPVLYRPAGAPANGQWALEGKWTITEEYVVPEDTGVLRLGFHAKDVYLVIEPAAENGRIEVRVDGKPVEDTADVRDGVLSPGESRLYHVVEQPEPGEHLLTLKVEGELRLFAFTFG
jgi:thiol-disulfide isomerase/thioredoxin